ncbi:hypothetical protein O7607_03805 [Micromonospora sp. WMMA1949]|uniref:ApeA N-terminal domain 1-containing protein n=1 Tax=Micromonospora sp. WMMA1949 TaxID=3015162 RepID=UPI0022B6F977|nr:hypothetical protein [Micromonospora sp. WMMA1949]MCZ7424851.1 hypothetical protein [Micromonospora sp. WMMA1949]
MTDGIPLKTRLQPDRYNCVWLVPDESGQVRRLVGDLELSADRPPAGSAYGNIPLRLDPSPSGTRSAGFPQQRSYPTLRGELRNGLDVVLIEAETFSMSFDAASIDGRAALVGWWPAPQETPLAFDDIKIQVTGLDAIAGVGPLKSFTFPAGGRAFYEHPWKVEANPDSEQTWSDGTATIDLSYDASLSIGDPYFYRMSFSPVVRIKLSDRLTFNECLEKWVEPLRRLTCLATGRAEKITYLAMGVQTEDRSTRDGRLQVYGTGITQDPYASREKDVRQKSPAFATKRDGISLLGLLRGWQSLLNEQHPLLETYGSSIGIPQQHPRARYLLLIQAMEGMHGYENKAKNEAQTAAHMARRDEALGSLREVSGIPQSAMRFVQRFLAKRPFSNLDTCLREVIESVPTNVMRELDDADLIRSVAADSRSPQGTPGSLRIIRNDLAHGTKGYPVYLLHEVSQILERVVRAHLLRILGCGEEVQARVARASQH